MRVLLTGGYGCIGSWIVRHLLQRGDQVFIYDLKEAPRRIRLLLSEEQVGRTTFVQGDVTDLASLKAAISAHRITHTIHLAGLIASPTAERRICNTWRTSREPACAAWKRFTAAAKRTTYAVPWRRWKHFTRHCARRIRRRST